MGRGGGGGGWLARCCTSHSVLDFCVTCFGLSWSTAQTINYTTYKERNLYPRTAYINQLFFFLFFNQKLTTTDLNHQCTGNKQPGATSIDSARRRFYASTEIGRKRCLCAREKNYRSINPPKKHLHRQSMAPLNATYVNNRSLLQSGSDDRVGQ